MCQTAGTKILSLKRKRKWVNRGQLVAYFGTGINMLEFLAHMRREIVTFFSNPMCLKIL